MANQPSGGILPFGPPADAPGPRFVKPIPAEQIARIMGEPVDLYKSLEQPRRGLLDRIASWLGTDRGFSFFLGFYSGTMFCCGTAILWVVLR